MWTVSIQTCVRGIAFGFMVCSLREWPSLMRADLSRRQTVLFPDPLGPTMTTPILWFNCSYNSRALWTCRQQQEGKEISSIGTAIRYVNLLLLLCYYGYCVIDTKFLPELVLIQVSYHDKLLLMQSWVYPAVDLWREPQGTCHWWASQTACCQQMSAWRVCWDAELVPPAVPRHLHSLWKKKSGCGLADWLNYH